MAIVALGAGWWWLHRPHAARPTPRPASQPPRGSIATGASALQPEVATAPATLTITVTDERGPVADATVRLAPADGEVVVVKTGGDGVAHADALAAGAWRISASAEGHVPAALAARTLAPGSHDAIALRLASGGRTLHGTVADATGGPVAGARIDAARLTAAAGLDAAVSTTLTAADGTYRLTVAPGTLVVGVASADYAPQSRRVEVGPAGAVADFLLVPGGVIEGLTLDAQTGAPIAGAAVVALRDSPSMLLVEPGKHRATSGADGKFRLTGLRPGAWDLTAAAPPRTTRAVTTVGLGVAEQVTSVELRLVAGPVIRGRVVDDAGAPAGNLELEAFASGDVEHATADPAGNFVLSGLHPGRYAISGSSPVYLRTPPTFAELVDRDVDGVVVHVERGLTIKGHVEPRQVCDVDRTLDLSHGAAATLTSKVTTGPDGEFAIAPAGTGPGELTARCASGDQGALHVAVTPGMADAVLAVVPGGAIAGRVVDASGAPIAGVSVVANSLATGQHLTMAGGTITSGAQSLTDAAGGFEIVGLAPGPVGLGVLDRGAPLHPHAPPPVITLAAREHKAGVELVIDRPDGVISGTVTGPDGAPLADAWVSAEPDLMSLTASMQAGGSRTTTMVMGPSGPGGPDGGDGGNAATPSPTLTDAQGHYALRGLFHARYTVVVEAQRAQLRGRATDVVPSATVNLRAVGISALSGTVRGPAGPVATFSVELSGPTTAVRSFTGGTFAFDRVDPGAYKVHAESADGSGDGTVTVTTGAPATVAIEITSHGTVTGVMVDAAGAPMAGLPVQILPDAGDGRIMLTGPLATTGPDGRFRIDHAAGRCLLIAIRSPRPFTRPGLVVEPGKTLDLGTIKVDDASDDPGAGSGPGSGGPGAPRRAAPTLTPVRAGAITAQR